MFKNIHFPFIKIISVFMIFLFVFVWQINKEIIVNIDGESQIISTNQIFAKSLIEDVANEHDLEEFSIPDQPIFLTDYSNIEINTPKKVKINIEDQVYDIETYSNTIETLTHEFNNYLQEEGNKNQVIFEGYKQDDQINDQQTLKATLVQTKLETKTKTEALEPKYIDNDDIYVGEEVLIYEGSDKKTVNTYEKIYKNNKIYSSKIINSEIVDQGERPVIYVGTKEKVINNLDTWNQIANCESSSNWSANTGNGYYGGLQISKATWDSYAPSVGISTDYPYQASKDEQILVAEQIQKNQGWSSWGSCSPI